MDKAIYPAYAYGWKQPALEDGSARGEAYPAQDSIQVKKRVGYCAVWRDLSEITDPKKAPLNHSFMAQTMRVRWINRIPNPR